MDSKLQHKPSPAKSDFSLIFSYPASSKVKEGGLHLHFFFYRNAWTSMSVLWINMNALMVLNASMVR